MHFRKRFSYDMDVVDITEHDLTVLVRLARTTGLIATALELLGSRIKHWACIIDLDEACLVEVRTVAHADPADEVLVPSIATSVK